MPKNMLRAIEPAADKSFSLKVRARVVRNVVKDDPKYLEPGQEVKSHERFDVILMPEFPNSQSELFMHAWKDKTNSKGKAAEVVVSFGHPVYGNARCSVETSKKYPDVFIETPHLFVMSMHADNEFKNIVEHQPDRFYEISTVPGDQEHVTELPV